MRMSMITVIVCRHGVVIRDFSSQKVAPLLHKFDLSTKIGCDPCHTFCNSFLERPATMSYCKRSSTGPCLLSAAKQCHKVWKSKSNNMDVFHNLLWSLPQETIVVAHLCCFIFSVSKLGHEFSVGDIDLILHCYVVSAGHSPIILLTYISLSHWIRNWHSFM